VLELDKVTDRLLPGDRFCCAATACSRHCRNPSLPGSSLPRMTCPPSASLRAALEQQADDNVTAVAVEASQAPDWRDLADRTQSSAEDEPTRHPWGPG
jgi:hypothetical protein